MYVLFTLKFILIEVTAKNCCFECKQTKPTSGQYTLYTEKNTMTKNGKRSNNVCLHILAQVMKFLPVEKYHSEN